MKENYQIYLPYQFHWRPQLVDQDAQLPNKKMKTMYLWNMSKSRGLTSTFFPINISSMKILLSEALVFKWLPRFYSISIAIAVKGRSEVVEVLNDHQR